MTLDLPGFTASRRACSSQATPPFSQRARPAPTGFADG